MLRILEKLPERLAVEGEQRRARRVIRGRHETALVFIEPHGCVGLAAGHADRRAVLERHANHARRREMLLQAVSQRRLVEAHGRGGRLCRSRWAPAPPRRRADRRCCKSFPGSGIEPAVGENAMMHGIETRADDTWPGAVSV